MGDALEADMDRLVALLSREAGKTLNDGIAEVREAADFCRYYALLAERDFTAPQTLKGPTGETNQLILHGRGGTADKVLGGGHDAFLAEEMPRGRRNWA